jgi:hypothetical protein
MEDGMCHKRTRDIELEQQVHFFLKYFIRLISDKRIPKRVTTNLTRWIVVLEYGNCINTPIPKRNI